MDGKEVECEIEQNIDNIKLSLPDNLNDQIVFIRVKTTTNVLIKKLVLNH